MDSLPLSWFSLDSLMLSWSSLLLTIALLLGFYFVVFNPWRQKSKAKAPLPPRPFALPIIGNLLQLGKKPNESLYALSFKYGPLMSLSLGMKTTVVVQSSAMAKEFLKTHDHIFAGRPIIATTKSFPDQIPSLVFRQYGPHWRKVRRIAATELFNHSRLQALQHLRREQLLITLRQIFDDRGKSVSIGHNAFYVSLNLLGNMIFSARLIDPRSQASTKFKDTVCRIMKIGGTPNLVDFFPFLASVDPQGLTREMAMHVKGMYDFFDVFIEKRVATRQKSSEQTKTQKDFLDVLLDITSEDFTVIDVRALILEIFVAGSETTSTTIEWGMAELIRNPRIMERVKRELDEKVGNKRMVEESDLERCPYLGAVVKELFRLHPPLPLSIPHKAESSCEVAGYLVPKDSEVIFNVWGIGRDAATWKEPLKFLPERFLEGEHSKMQYRGQDFEFIPFGAGRRICPGLPLANTMVHLVMASLSHAFEWTMANGEEVDMGDDLGITLKKAVDLRAIPTPRLPSHVYCE